MLIQFGCLFIILKDLGTFIGCLEGKREKKQTIAQETRCLHHSFCLWPFLFLEIVDLSVLEAQGRCGFKQQMLWLSGYEVSKVQETQVEETSYLILQVTFKGTF